MVEHGSKRVTPNRSVQVSKFGFNDRKSAEFGFSIVRMVVDWLGKVRVRLDLKIQSSATPKDNHFKYYEETEVEWLTTGNFVEVLLDNHLSSNDCIVTPSRIVLEYTCTLKNFTYMLKFEHSNDTLFGDQN